MNDIQTTTDQISTWAKGWKIRSNETKSVRVDFVLRFHYYTPKIIDGPSIPQASHARYLSLNPDGKLNWQEYIRAKRLLLNVQFDRFYWMIGRNSNLCLTNKKLTYTSIFKPGCEISGTVRDSNLITSGCLQN